MTPSRRVILDGREVEQERSTSRGPARVGSRCDRGRADEENGTGRPILSAGMAEGILARIDPFDCGLLAGLPVYRHGFCAAAGMLAGVRSATFGLTSIASGDTRNDVACLRRTAGDRGPDHPSHQATQHGTERRPGAILLFLILLSEAGVHRTQQTR